MTPQQQGLHGRVLEKEGLRLGELDAVRRGRQMQEEAANRLKATSPTFSGHA